MKFEGFPMHHEHPCRKGESRRAFLVGGGMAFAGSALGVLAYKHLQPATRQPASPYDRDALFVKYDRKYFTGKSVEQANPEYALPGRFPGRVIEVHHPGSIVDQAIRVEPAQEMLDAGMKQLTGATDALPAWRSFFQKGDRVGIKVNPVGYSRNPSVRGSISNFAVIWALVDTLKKLGIPAKDIVLFERYADEFRAAGYESFVERELPGVRWFASSAWYGGGQTDLAGRDLKNGRKPEPDSHVLGYDPDVHHKFDFLLKGEHNPNRAEDHLSHVGRIVTGDHVNKIITIPVLKDHRSAGITLSLKNISHGMANNVNRTHAGKEKDENRCGVFIPHIVALKPIRQKCVLHILDGLVGVYEGGPGSWNNSWGTWEYKSLFFATDPVALDHVCWDIVDAERAKRGWQPVAKMGVAGNNRSGTEAFHLRQPEHVELAGTLGLGIFDPARIEHQRVQVGKG
jgi:uncharacterized protein (DUF362 family)